ncbi:MAG: hypothetical protein ACRDJH_08810, partial [Thermomicrobiales bacterium]
GSMMLDSYQDLIDELLGTPQAVREVIAGGAASETLRLIAELRDRDALVLERLQRMVRQPFPHLKALPEIPEPGEPPADADALLTTFDSGRGELVSLLMNLTIKDWEKPATHDTRGHVSLADEVEAHVEFDEDHVARILG